MTGERFFSILSGFGQAASGGSNATAVEPALAAALNGAQYCCEISMNKLGQPTIFLICLLLAAILFAQNPPAQPPDLADSAQGEAPAASGPKRPGTSDPARLEVVEELSESLANDMLDLSLAVRDRDQPRVAGYFPAQLSATPFWSTPLPVREQVKWVSRHGWTADAQNAGHSSQRSARPRAVKHRVPGEEFVGALFAFLAHFQEIEDARFKVSGAQFAASADVEMNANIPTAKVGSEGTARLKFYLVGRDTDGQREWTRGAAGVAVRRAASGRWQFESFELLSLESMLATTELFSEVSLPAGVAASLPSFAERGGPGFAWYGAAAGDFNRDGWLDLVVTSPDRNYLYLNDAQGRFRDASLEAGVELLDRGVAPLVLDYDNDGDSDVFLSSVGHQLLLENRHVPDGKLELRDVSWKAGVGRVAIGFSAVAGDVNGDGHTDIYVACYNHFGRVTPDSWYQATNGTPNLLYINQGDGTFREEAARWGVDDRRWSYAAAFADVNRDGRLDLYVANDFGENALFIHHGDKFVDEARERGVVDPGNGMGVAFGDYDNDGQLDLHVTNMSSTAGNRIVSRLFPGARPGENVYRKLASGNNLYRNAGNGYYRDVTAESAGFSGGWAWGGGFLDFDNDGWEDLLTPNGFLSGSSMKDT